MNKLIELFAVPVRYFGSLGNGDETNPMFWVGLMCIVLYAGTFIIVSSAMLLGIIMLGFIMPVAFIEWFQG